MHNQTKLIKFVLFKTQPAARGESRNLSRGVIRYVTLNINSIFHKSQYNNFLYNKFKRGAFTLLTSPPSATVRVIQKKTQTDSYIFSI